MESRSLYFAALSVYAALVIVLVLVYMLYGGNRDSAMLGMYIMVAVLVVTSLLLALIVHVRQRKTASDTDEQKDEWEH